MGNSPRCLYYAFGGGLGHGVRTLALARKLAQIVGGRHHVLLNTPFASTLRTEAVRQPLIQVHALASQATPAESTRYVKDAIESFRPDVFVVDTFPRGLGGDLVSALPGWRFGSRILICRTLPARYVDEYQLSGFVLEHYDDVIVPGEASPLSDTVSVFSTAPFLIRDYRELPPLNEAAKLMRSEPCQRVVLLVGTGTVDECFEMRQLARSLAVRSSGQCSIRLALPVEIHREVPEEMPLVIRHFPLIECLPAARVVVGAGGYNLTHEVRALGVPAITQPRRRKYDQQTSRVPAASRFNGLDDLWHRLAAELAKPPPTIKPYHNGAADAACRIAESV